MIQVIGIGGEPATGKTRLMRRLLSELGEGGAVLHASSGRGSHWIGTKHDAAKVIVLGHYNEAAGTYGGTDRLSMSVQPVIVEMLAELAPLVCFEGWTVLFEGDRLFNRSFIEAVERLGIPCNWLLLMASKEAKEARRLARADTKTAGWIAGREKKYTRLRDWLAGRVTLDARAAEQATPGSPMAGGSWFYFHELDGDTESIALIVGTLVAAFRRRAAPAEGS